MSARAVLLEADGLLAERHPAEAVRAFLYDDVETLVVRAQERTVATLLAVGGEVA